MSRKINPKAKKYANLRKKQALANKYLKQARKELGVNHKQVMSAMNRLHMFQKKHKQARRQTFSMTDLTTKDVELYEQLLDSVLDSTYLNPSKYKDFESSQLDFAIQQGWAKNQEEAKRVYDFANSDLVEELKDVARIDIPSKIVEKYAKYIQGELTQDDFIQMSRAFMNYYESGEMSTGEFFDFADSFKDFADVNKSQKEFGIDQSTEDLFTEALELGIVGNNDFDKAAKEYKQSPQDEDGNIVSFIEYFKQYYL